MYVLAFLETVFFLFDFEFASLTLSDLALTDLSIFSSGSHSIDIGRVTLRVFFGWLRVVHSLNCQN